MWDITAEDVERIRQLFTPNVPDVMVDIIQPLIPKTIHTTPPDEDYVAPATKSILDDLLEEFKDEILNVAMVDEGAECSHTKDLEELERLLTKDPQSHYMEIQVHLVIINPEPFIHTQLMSPEWCLLLFPPTLDPKFYVKPIAPISIRCNGATTLANAYSQMYNGKSRHLGNNDVRIKRLLDDLRVTTAKLMLLVYKLLLLVLKVNAASTKVITAQRLRLLKEFLLSEKG
ncbi:hypothetical protein Tco_0931403 [Tanacetum coccineum]